MSGSVRFPLAARRRSRARALGAVLLVPGLILFAATLGARRSEEPGMFLLALLGALGVAVGLRQLLWGARPLVVSDRHVWMRARVFALARLQAVEAEGDRLTLVREDGMSMTEEIQGASLAAVEVARRAGMPPPRKGTAEEGKVRYERRAP